VSFAAVVERLRKVENPYPGLRAFDVDESHLFFGRDEQVGELVQRLARHRFLAVLGVSGSGKSSLVRAGLIPALERGGVWEAAQRWRRVVTQPAGAPFDSLAADLAKAGLDGSRLRESSYGLIDVARQLPANESLLVVVDQFEELFRYKDLHAITDEARRIREQHASEAAEFVQLLLAASRHHPPIYVVLTMRTDYLGDCAEFRDLPETLNECQYLIPRMTRQQRKEAIEGPLGRTAIAPTLVQRLLNDAGDEPDQLPVLQHALMRTWSHWRKSDPNGIRRIELQDYEAIGGFEGAVNRHADDLLAGVPGDIAERVFKRLTAHGRGNRERRDPAKMQELWDVCGANTPERQQQVSRVIDHFRQGDATFLRPREGQIHPHTYVDITHESLIRLWRKLRDEWLMQEQLSAKTLVEVVERAKNWKAGAGELLSGLDFVRIEQWNRERNQTRAWAQHYIDDASLADAEAFIKASAAAEWKRQLKRRVLWGAAAGLGLFVVATTVFVLFWRQQAAESTAVNALKQEEQARAGERTKGAIATAYAQEVLTLQTELARRGSDTVPPPPSPTSELKPRLYIQVRSPKARDDMSALAMTLRGKGIDVPATQVLDTGPSMTELRYFRKGEVGRAKEILAVVNASIGEARLAYVDGYEQSQRIRAYHFELWVAPTETGPQHLAKALNSNSERVRKAAGGELARDYRDSPQAIGLILDTLSARNLPDLSTDGLINALYFLNGSEPSAWTDEHKMLAREAIRRVRAMGVERRPQTAQELRALEQRLYLYDIEPKRKS
jgi:AAA ATPase domain